MAMGPPIAANRFRKGTGNEADLQTAAREDLVNLKGDLAYLQQPLATSRNTLPAPAVFSAATCAATPWPSVETLA